jgi:Lrp/AsnC family leucine-responsive transcriptional regulator
MAKNSGDNLIDATDRRLLRVLQHDGRITNQALASQCGLSPAASYDRVKRLKTSGIIQSFTALLDPVALDAALLVFIEIILDRTTDDVFTAFADHIRALPEVMECHMVAGGFDYLLKVRVADMGAYRAFLGERLTTMPGVRETRTYAVLEEVKLTTALPV